MERVSPSALGRYRVRMRTLCNLLGCERVLFGKIGRSSVLRLDDSVDRVRTTLAKSDATRFAFRLWGLIIGVGLVAGQGCRQKTLNLDEVAQAEKSVRRIPMRTTHRMHRLLSELRVSHKAVVVLNVSPHSPLEAALEITDMPLGEENLVLICKSEPIDIVEGPSLEFPRLRNRELTVRIRTVYAARDKLEKVPNMNKRHCFALAIDSALVETVRVESDNWDAVTLALGTD